MPWGATAGAACCARGTAAGVNTGRGLPELGLVSLERSTDMGTSCFILELYDGGGETGRGGCCGFAPAGGCGTGSRGTG